VSLRERITRFGQSAAEAETEEFRHAFEQVGVTPIGDCRAGEKAWICGSVRWLTVRPRGKAPAVEIEIFDGTGAVRVVWMGRRAIGGIEPGRRLIVHGRLTAVGREPVIYNPRYRLLP